MTRDDDSENLFDLLELFPAARPASPGAPTGSAKAPRPVPPVVTTATAAVKLRNHLQAIFDLQDERYKAPGPKRTFKIDDCRGSDRWKWSVSADVLDTEPPTLVLHFRDIPCDDQLLEVLRGMGVSPQSALEHTSFEITLRARYAPTIRRLIPAVRRVVRSHPARRWLTRRVGDSLKSLADHLAEFRD